MQPNTCAIIYTSNPKRGNYTGFTYDIPAKTKFDYERFLLRNALPGPGSNIHCILESKGKEGETIDCWLTKDFKKSHIPGFLY